MHPPVPTVRPRERLEYLGQLTMDAPAAPQHSPVVSAARTQAGPRPRPRRRPDVSEAETQFLVGADENGLGARLGPLLVTAVLAEATETGQRWLRRRVPKALAADLDDSKNLVSFKNPTLGEAWARALCPSAKNPTDLFRALTLVDEKTLRRRCPRSAERQCWQVRGHVFNAEDAVVNRLTKHLRTLERRGIKIIATRSASLCVKQLNDERLAGKNRFISDLHAMEALVLELRRIAGKNVHAICGKVGGIADYEKFFGPLSGQLRTTLNQERAHSAYHFPSVGEVHFVQDADASNALVMLASLVGKYLRELLMGQIFSFYQSHNDQMKPASGYHDPVSSRFVELAHPLRKRFKVPVECFERRSDTR